MITLLMSVIKLELLLLILQQ